MMDIIIRKQIDHSHDDKENRSCMFVFDICYNVCDHKKNHSIIICI